MRFAIIGGGPVALALLSYLVYCKQRYPTIEITIFLGARSGDYTRNHVVSISNEIATILGTLLHNPGCLNPNKNPDVSIQIKCLETILFKRTDKTGVNIIDGQWTPDSDMRTYNYIFCADGTQSSSRTTFFGQYTPLTVRFNNQLLTLYYDFPEGCLNFETTPHKKNYDIGHLKQIWDGDENYNHINALVSLIYNMNQRTLEFTEPRPTPSSINRWVTGFAKFDEFDDCFSVVIEFIRKNSQHVKSEFERIARERQIYYDSHMRFLIENPQKLIEIYEIYKQFVKRELESVGSIDKHFLLHFVRPAVFSFGIHFDEPHDNPTLMYCLERKSQKIWLIGDSCNSYPPGHSLEIGIRDVIHLVNIIFSKLYPSFQHVVLAFRVIKTQLCDKLDKYNYSGGYENLNPSNQTKLTFTQLLEKLRLSRLPSLPIPSDTSSDIDYYNRYQFFNFFNNLTDIMCNPEFKLTGGKKNKIRYKNTKKYKKTQKYKKQKIQKNIKNTKIQKTKKYKKDKC